MESVIEANKEGYYRALRQTQTTLGNPLPQWYPWILFFLHALTRQKDNLLDRLAAEPCTTPGVESQRSSMPGGISPPSFRSAGFIRPAKREVDRMTIKRGGMACLDRKICVNQRGLTRFM